MSNRKIRNSSKHSKSVCNRLTKGQILQVYKQLDLRDNPEFYITQFTDLVKCVESGSTEFRVLFFSKFKIYILVSESEDYKNSTTVEMIFPKKHWKKEQIASFYSRFKINQHDMSKGECKVPPIHDLVWNSSSDILTISKIDWKEAELKYLNYYLFNKDVGNLDVPIGDISSILHSIGISNEA